MEIFKNKEVLDINYIPTEDLLLFRENEKEKLKIVFNSMGGIPSHLMCYGFAGTGKTMTVRFMSRKYGFHKFNEKVVYINTANCATELQALSYLLSELGQPVGGKMVQSYYAAFKKMVKDYDLRLLVILDEVDKLLYRSGDNFIYNLLEMGNVSFIMITNNALCFDRMEDRVKSRLGGPPRVLFEPYNAIQIKQILDKRAFLAFNIVNMEASVVPKVAALAAQEHGDARRAISLLKACGDLAEARGTIVMEEYIDEADEMTESSEVNNIIRSLPMQAKAVLKALYTCIKNGKNGEVTSTDLYEAYTRMAEGMYMKVMTDRRIRDYLWELEGAGLIASRMSSVGRNIREKKIRLGVPIKILEPIINKME